jgi:DNA-binding response OmpR family regulator
VILITAFGDKGTHTRAQKAQAAAVLDKPFEIDELLTKLHEILPRSPEHNGTDGTTANEENTDESTASTEKR